MLFSELPLIEDTAGTEILVYKDGVASRTKNTLHEYLDQQMVNLVLSRHNPSKLVNDHIGDNSIHLGINDAVTGTGSTWSSSKIDSAISGSSSWVTLDNIPEGTTNLYYTEERAQAAIANASLGVPSVTHSQVAAAIVAMWQGWTNQEFTYYLKLVDDSPVTVTVDGVESVDQFTVTPGPHNITVSKTTYWLNNTLAHEVYLYSGTDRVVTPELTLDAFKDGDVNQFWRPDSLEDVGVLEDIVEHYDTNFSEYHSLPIDNNSISSEKTWSSLKMVQYFNQELSNTYPPTVTKEFAVFIERANSGQHLSGYRWETDDNGNGTYTHRVARIFNHDNYKYSMSSPSSDYYFRLPETGNWLIYWVASTDLNPYFTNVTDVSTYIAEWDDFSKVKLEYPGVINKWWSSTPYLSLVTQFTSNQNLDPAYEDNWLVPRSIPNRYEVYSQIHFEKIT